VNLRARLAGRLTHILSDRGPKLLRDLVSLVGGQSLSMVIGFVTFAYLARSLDTVRYGMLEYAIAIAAFAGIVIECGVGAIGVRLLGQAPGRARELAATVPAARMLLALAVVPAVGILGGLSQDSAEARALIWIFAISLFGVTLKQEWLLQGTERMALAALAQPIRTLVFALGVLALVGPETRLQTIGWIELAAVTAVSVYYLVVQLRLVTRFGLNWRFGDLVRLLGEGLSVGLSNILWAFMVAAPMLMLGGLGADGHAPAHLGASQRIVLSLLTVSFLYHFNLYPVLVRKLAEDVAGWLRVVSASARLVAWGGVAVALALSALAGPIMVTVFGPGFAAAAPVLAVLAWIFPLRLQSGHARWSLIARGAQRRLLWAEGAGAAALVATGLVLIPGQGVIGAATGGAIAGAIGAALALLAGITVSAVLTQIAVVRLIGPVAVVGPSLVPLGAALAGLALVRLSGAGGLAAAALAFGPFVLAFGFGWRPLLADLQRIAYAKEGAAAAG